MGWYAYIGSYNLQKVNKTSFWKNNKSLHKLKFSCSGFPSRNINIGGIVMGTPGSTLCFYHLIQLKYQEWVFKLFLCETQWFFNCLKMANHGHLHWRNYTEKFAAVLHDEIFHANRAMWPLKAMTGVPTLLHFTL